MSLEQAKRLAGSAAAGAISAATTAGGLLARGVSASARALVPASDRERITFASLSQIEVVNGGQSAEAMLLLLGYAEGWQAWALEGGRPRELTSRRDNSAVALLATLPDPRPGMSDVLLEARPLVAVVHALQQQTSRASPPTTGAAGPGALPSAVEQQRPVHALRLYSLRSHGYVRTLTFHQPILALDASERLLVVALPGQVQALDAGSLQHLFTCLAYLPPTAHRPFLQQGGGGEPSQHRQAGAEIAEAVATLAPLALGSRWLAYASDQAVAVESNQATAQRVPLRTISAAARRASGVNSCAAAAAMPVGASSRAGSGGGLTAAGVSEAALLAAQKGGQQLKAGLTAVGSASFKYLSNQYQQWRGSGMGQQGGMEVDEADAAVAGTVMVRDAVSRRTVAHFRAHTSPLAALQFSHGGDLLATASVRGHNIHVFRVSGGKGGATPAPVQHLYCLHRGVTGATIRGLAFAPDSRWVAVSSGRGTTHLFRTPAAAVETAVWELPTGGAGPQSKVKGGVSGRPERVLAIARARKPGLLSSGAAGAAAWAALSLAGHPAETAPVAASFVLANASGGPDAGRTPQDDPMRLIVVTVDGMLTQHCLHQPAAVEAGAAAATTAAAELQAEDAALPVLEESERWDVCRHRGWPEREEALPGLTSPSSEGDEVAAGAAAPGGVAATILAYEEAGAGTRQSWVAQAESVPTGAAGALPLWHDAQFRFVAVAAAEGAGAGLLSALGGEGANNSLPARAGRT